MYLLRLLLLFILSFRVLAIDYHFIQLTSDESVYCLNQSTQKLKKIGVLVGGSQVKIPKESYAQLYPLEDGRRDTTGFYSNILIKALTLPNFCKTKHGFFITGTIPLGIEEDFFESLLNTQIPDQRFKEYYNEGNGQLKISKVRGIINKNAKRFSQVWNKIFSQNELSYEEREKSRKIYEELKKVANREVMTPTSLLFLQKKKRVLAMDLAEKISRQEISNYGFAPSYGAWDVAVIGTAKRLGFGHAPCAEFMSEIIREAYVRAGYDFTEDFTPDIDQRLLFTWDMGETVWGPQSVRGLSDRLMQAGWVAWDPTSYRPMIGAITMAWLATTPGHAYLTAGMNGQFIVDNGNPKGLDLRVTEKRHVKNHLKNMYVHGVFWLPPGISPEKW